MIFSPISIILFYKNAIGSSKINLKIHHEMENEDVYHLEFVLSILHWNNKFTIWMSKSWNHFDIISYRCSGDPLGKVSFGCCL